MALTQVASGLIASVSGASLTGTQNIPKATLPTGSVLQVVQVSYQSTTSSSSSTFADTGLTASITPSSTSSKILVSVIHGGCRKTSNDTQLRLQLLRSSTVLSNFEDYGGANNSTTNNGIGTCAGDWLDSPSTTSSVTYKTQLASAQNNAIVYVGAGTSIASMATITLMEIAA
jgi:hypothetical protein